MKKLFERLLRPFRAHRTVYWYEEDIKDTEMVKVWEKIDEALEAMDEFFKSRGKK